jgi:hypothetical protein
MIIADYMKKSAQSDGEDVAPFRLPRRGPMAADVPAMGLFIRRPSLLNTHRSDPYTAAAATAAATAAAARAASGAASTRPVHSAAAAAAAGSMHCTASVPTAVGSTAMSAAMSTAMGRKL